MTIYTYRYTKACRALCPCWACTLAVWFMMWSGGRGLCYSCSWRSSSWVLCRSHVQSRLKYELSCAILMQIASFTTNSMVRLVCCSILMCIGWFLYKHAQLLRVVCFAFDECVQTTHAPSDAFLIDALSHRCTFPQVHCISSHRWYILVSSSTCTCHSQH